MFIYFICILLSIQSAQALVLTNGQIVSRPIAESTWNKLKQLKSDYNIFILYDLYKASKSPELKINPSEIPIPGYRNRTKDTLSEIQQLGLCNQDGFIDKETALVINASIHHFVTKGHIPLWFSMSSPISWKNYFTKEYWLNKN
jgi:hypothetical protein